MRKLLALFMLLIFSTNGAAENPIVDGLKDTLLNAGKQALIPNAVQFSAVPAGLLMASIQGTVTTRNHDPQGVLVRTVSLDFQCQNRQTSVSLRFGIGLNGHNVLGNNKTAVNFRFGRDIDNATWTMPATEKGLGSWTFAHNRPEILGALFGADTLVGTVYDGDGKPLEFKFDTSRVKTDVQDKDFFCKEAWNMAVKKYGAKEPPK